MKKLFIIALVALTATIAMAQEKMKVVLTDGTTSEFIVKKVTQIYFDGQDITLTIGQATNITSNSADIPFTMEGADGTVSAGIILSTNSDLSGENYEKQVTNTMADGQGTANVTNLSANTIYYYKAFAKVDDIYFYSEETLSFTTLEDNQTVIYREPYTTWGASKAETKAYMSSYLLYKEEDTTLAYFGIDKEVLMTYRFVDSKLVMSSVVVTTGNATQDEIAAQLQENGYVYVGAADDGILMFLSIDVKTFVALEEHTDVSAFYVYYYDWNYIFPSDTDNTLFEEPYLGWNESMSTVKSAMANKDFELIYEASDNKYIIFDAKHEERYTQCFFASDALNEIAVPFLASRVSIDDIHNFLTQNLSYYYLGTQDGEYYYATLDQESFVILWKPTSSAIEQYIVTYLSAADSRQTSTQDIIKAVSARKSFKAMDEKTVGNLERKMWSDRLMRVKERVSVNFDIKPLLK